MEEKSKLLLEKAKKELDKIELIDASVSINNLKAVFEELSIYQLELERQNHDLTKTLENLGLIQAKNEEYAAINEELRQANEELFESKRIIEIERDKNIQTVIDLNKSQSIAKVGIWKWFTRENRIEWSDEMFTIFGVDKKSFKGNLEDIMDNCIHPEDKPRVEDINRIIAGTGNKITIEYRIVLPDKTIKHIYAESGEMLRDQNNEVYFSTGIVQDITERKLAEQIIRESEKELKVKNDELDSALEELRQTNQELHFAKENLEISEQSFRNMFEENQAMMWIVDPSNNDIINVNQATANFYGYSREELCKMNISAINVLSHEELIKRRQQAVEKKQGYFVSDHKLASGEIRTVEVYPSITTYYGRKVLFVIVHDITERKMAEQKIFERESDL